MGMAYFDGGDKRMAAKCFSRRPEKEPGILQGVRNGRHESRHLCSANSANTRRPSPVFESVAWRTNPGNTTARTKLDALIKALN